MKRFFHRSVCLHTRFAARSFHTAHRFRQVNIDHVKLLVDKNNFSEANAEIDKVLQEHPNDLESLFTKASIAGATGDVNALHNNLDKMLTLDPTNIKALIGKASIHATNNDFEKSLEVLMKAQEAHPNDDRLLYNTATILFQLQRFDEAVDLLEKLFKVQPNHPIGMNLLSQVYLATKQYDKVIEIADWNIKNNVEVGAAYSIKVACFTAQQKYAEALEACEAASAQDPENTSILNDMVYLLNAAGRASEVDAVVRKIHKLDPSDEGAAQYIRGYEIGKSIREQGVIKSAWNWLSSKFSGNK